MRAKNIILGLVAAMAFVVRGATVSASGDTSGATDTTAIQNALNAAGSGGTVTLGSGTYYINAQLTVDGGVTLTGQGWDNTIIKQVATPGDATRVMTVKGGSTVSQVTLTGGHIKTTGKYVGGAGAMVQNGTLSWCCITNNAVECYSYGVGGGVSIWNSGGTVEHCIIADNSITVTANSNNKGHGGGVGIYLPNGTCTVGSCLVRGNRAVIASDGAGFGGGVAIDHSGMGGAVNIRNTTFVGNSIGESGKSGKTWGAGVYSDDDKAHKLTVLNCIFYGNTAANPNTTGDVNVSSNEAFSYTIYQGNICYGTVDYNCFEKATDVVGTHSVSGSAIFANAAAGDYTLSASSPAKASGTTYTGIGTDLAGNNYAATPSMGCYEYGSTAGDVVVPGGDAGGEGEGEGDGEGTDDPPVVNPPTVDPTDAPAASGDTTGATDTQTIQNLIDAAASTHGTVTLATGIYYLNAALNIHDGVTLKGQGWGNTVLKPAASASIRCAELTGGATLEGVTLTGGYSANGGGAHVTDGTISWCCISNNTSTSGYGAGVSFNQGKGRIDHSIVTGNTANGAYGAGIGMKDQSGAVVIDTCLVSGNACTSTSGGGMTIESIGSGRSVEICNCTVTGNSTRYNAGGVHIKNDYSGTIILRNNILSGNSAGSNLPKKPDLTLENSTADVAEYNLFGTADEAVGTGSSVGSAPFVGNGDYRLSQAKELGYVENASGCVDLDNQARSGALDVGCFEFGASAPVVHNHVWGAPSYVWTSVSGGYTCTATATCTGDASHTTNKTVTATYKVTKEPTTEATGTGTYTAAFDSPFATQTKNVTLDKLPKEDPPHVDPTDAAKPSGDTTGASDTKTIQDLIDAAAPNHGAVTLGSGTFYLNKELMVTNGVTLIGQGWVNTVLTPASTAKIRCATLNGSAKLEGVTLTGGSYSYGAGAHVVDGTISWCCISNNVQTGASQYGGGVSFFQGRGRIDHSIIANNRQTVVGFGAGIGMKSQTASVTIDTCLIYGNDCASGSGGGVMAESIGSGKAVTILNCTITGNSTFYNGGGVHVKNGDNGTCVLINTILSGNTSAKSSTNRDLTVENASVAGSANCLFGTSNEAVGSAYVVGTAPFVGNGDYRLSEALELGYEDDDATVVDLDRNARLGRYDVGCYEFGSSAFVERPGVTIYVD